MKLRYVPYHLLTDEPNIIVDGSGNKHTRLTLSHWPGNRTPAQYKDDLSAQIAFRYVEDENRASLDGVEVVSNNHFDEDGLVSVFAMVDPEKALAMKDFLIEVARAGDFSMCHDRDAARVSFVLSAWTDPDRSPLSRRIFGGTTEELNQVLYEELLKRLPKVVDKVGNLKEFWEPEDRVLEATENAIIAGKIKIEEDRDIDLAVVTLPDDGILDDDEVLENPSSWISSELHPIAVHNKIDCFRVLVIRKQHYELYYRYETWIDFVSRILKERIDLANLVKRLNTTERSGGQWSFSGVDKIISRLKLEGAEESSISPSHFLDYIRGSLTTTPLGIG